MKFFDEGEKYQTTIFNQDRFKAGESGLEKAVFNPTSATQEIFNWLKTLQTASKTILYGPAGIGKSWAFNILF